MAKPRDLLGARKQGGRPRSTVPHSQVSAWVPTDVHDQLVRMASAREVSVSRIVNRLVVLTLQKPPAD